MADDDFEAAWRTADRVPGWLKRGQAKLLWDEAKRLPDGATVVEIGSHQGRSTVVLAQALQPTDGRLIAVDPFVEGRLFGGTPTRDSFERNIHDAGLEQTVHLKADYSTALRPVWTEAFDMLYIDGKHDYWTVRDDLLWRTHLAEGGAVVIHDCFSSIGVTLAILRHVLFAGDLAYEQRSDSQALFRKRRPTTSDRWRIIREMPWWIRNVGLKVLLRLRLRPIARLLGHDSPYDPY